MEFLEQISQDATFYAFIYYFIVAIGALYVFYRFGYNKLTLLVVLIFWEGLLSYASKVVPFPFELYRIGIVVYTFLLFFPKIIYLKYKYDNLINISFLLFSISFFISNISQLNSILTILSQYGFKYGLPFLLYHGLKDVSVTPQKSDYLSKLLVFIIFIQVGFSVIKVILIGFIEAIVGSLSSKGAGVAVVIPILGFLLYWLSKRGKLNRKQWLIAFSLLFIAVASIKRSPVFIFPVIIVFLASFMAKKLQPVRFLKFIPVFMLLIYLGVKTNPTLNPDKSMWGDFDIEYAYDYAMKYSFGTEEIDLSGDQTYGRGGSLLILFSPHKLDLNDNFKLFFGHGIVDVALKKMGRFTGGKAYGIEHEGLVSNAIILIYAIGYLGVFFYLVFAYSIIRNIRFIKFRMLVFGFFLWEFFFYGGVTLTSSAMAFLFIFICLYSNQIFLKNGIIRFDTSSYHNTSSVLDWQQSSTNPVYDKH